MDATTDQAFPSVSVGFKNARGEPAPIDGVPVWGSSDDTVLAVTPAADGLTAMVNTVGAGTARISVQADADLGAGVATITGVSEDVNVTIGPNSVASAVTLDLGAPADKP